MKKLLVIAVMAITLSACSNDPKTESETSTQEETMRVDTNSVNNIDSTKAMADKLAKDSTDAAHGHTH